MDAFHLRVYVSHGGFLGVIRWRRAGCDTSLHRLGCNVRGSACGKWSEAILMLLSVEPSDDYDIGTVLDLWEIGGAHRVVRPPCQPHYYSDVEQGTSELVMRRCLSNPSLKRQLYRVDFPNLYSINRYRLPDALESHKRFVDVLLSEYGFACPSPAPRVLFWDVESFTFSPVAPNPLRDTIRSIAVWGVDVAVLDRRDWDAAIQFSPERGDFCFGLCWYVDDDHDERDVIESFLSFVREFDPDVLAGFNDGHYDIPLLMQRCAALRVPCRLGRDGSPPYILERMYERRGKTRAVERVRIRGRVHLDVYLEVLLDQTLFDLKGRGQNEVADHFGFAPILTYETWAASADAEYVLDCLESGEIPVDFIDHANIPTERVAELNLDDTRCGFALANLYLRNILSLCEEFSAPLNLMCERSPSHIPNWFYGQDYSELGIISDGYNGERFPQIFGRGGKPFEAAYVACLRRGVFRNVEHIDFRGFYPSIMVEYNLSPETVSLVEIKPYTGEYHFDKQRDYWIVEVPDVPKKKGKPNFEKACQFVCRIDMTHDSVTKRKLLDFSARRNKLKAQYRKTKDERLHSQQYALKVIQNKLYGYNGMFYALYGNILVAILIAALARYHIKLKIAEEEVKDFKTIEVDTDGFYGVMPQ